MSVQKKQIGTSPFISCCYFSFVCGNQQISFRYFSTFFGVCSDMSTPTSPITAVALGLTSGTGCVPSGCGGYFLCIISKETSSEILRKDIISANRINFSVKINLFVLQFCLLILLLLCRNICCAIDLGLLV